LALKRVNTFYNVFYGLCRKRESRRDVKDDAMPRPPVSGAPEMGRLARRRPCENDGSETTRNFVRPFPYKSTALRMNVVFTLDCRVGSYRAFSDIEIVMSVAKLNEQFAVFTGGR
jgi:hypothetical protein